MVNWGLCFSSRNFERSSNDLLCVLIGSSLGLRNVGTALLGSGFGARCAWRRRLLPILKWFPGFLALARLLLCGRSFGPLSGSFQGFALARIIDQLNYCQLCVVADAPAQLQDSGVAASPIFIALAKLVEKTAQRRHAGGSRRRA